MHMKIDRLIGIIAAIQQHGRVTAPYLAERFEVSRRTIARDIDALCRAGIPIVTSQGAGGGISLMEGFTLDGVLTKDELAAVFAGLRSLDSVSNDSGTLKISRKLGLDAVPADGMRIDLASFYKGDLTDKIALIRRAISESRVVEFTYYSPRGESRRRMDPQLIFYRWSDWYALGWCHMRGDFRMFKLRRMWDVNMAQEQFAPRRLPAEQLEPDGGITDDYFVTAIYAPSEKYRLAEEYGPGSFSVLPDGRLFTRWGFSSPEKARDWLISFGSRVQVTAPDEMVDMMRAEAEKMCRLYTGHDHTLS